MRISDLRERLTLSFGVGSHFPVDIAISELGSRSVNEALAHGYEPDEVWLPVKEVLEKPVKPEKLFKTIEKYTA